MQHRHWQSKLAKRDWVTAFFVSITFIMPFHAPLSSVQPPPSESHKFLNLFQAAKKVDPWNSNHLFDSSDEKVDTNIKLTMMSNFGALYRVWAHVAQVCWIFWGLMVAVFVRSPPAPLLSRCCRWKLGAALNGSSSSPPICPESSLAPLPLVSPCHLAFASMQSITRISYIHRRTHFPIFTQLLSGNILKINNLTGKRKGVGENDLSWCTLCGGRVNRTKMVFPCRHKNPEVANLLFSIYHYHFSFLPANKSCTE